MYLLFFLIWVIFNGKITLEICLFGIVIAAVIFAFTCKYMDYSIEKEKKNLKNLWRFIDYVWTLILEIVKANISVIQIILNEEDEIDPAIVTFETDLQTPAARAFLSNAITLTPGTITVTLEENEITVHCLDESLSEGIEDLVFQDKLRKMEKNY